MLKTHPPSPLMSLTIEKDPSSAGSFILEDRNILLEPTPKYHNVPTVKLNENISCKIITNQLINTIKLTLLN